MALTLQDLDNASARFQELEQRGSFYDLARGLFERGFRLEGYVLLLATWNFASFRYAATKFDINGLDAVMQELESILQEVESHELTALNLADISERVRFAFDALARMKEVGYTGASKLLHLRAPRTFVIWDEYIRGGKSARYYTRLECVQRGLWTYHQYGKDGSGYVRFLREMQARFGCIEYPADRVKTLAKAIDEFNFVNVTLPIQQIEAQEADAKKAQRSAAEMRAVQSFLRSHPEREYSASELASETRVSRNKVKALLSGVPGVAFNEVTGRFRATQATSLPNTQDVQ